jgi:hypothetical protein
VARYATATEPALREAVARALVNKGATLAKEGDQSETGQAWARCVRDYADQRESAAVAAFGLATLSAVEADLASALRLLDIAAAASADTARVCARSLSGDAGVRAHALEELQDLQSSDSDAANFLGISVWASGEKTRAHDLWAQSAQSGDTVAPLLMRRLEASS